MSRPQPPGPGRAAVETLLGDLISYYWEGAGDGQLRVCRQAALTHRAQQLLDRGGPLGLHLFEDMGPALGGCSWGDPSPAQDVCPKLVKALEFLELISVNLLLFPWRKEIRSLKTYTGSFAYWVQPVLSKHGLDTILGRLGYTATSEAEFLLAQPISKEDAKQMVFEIFLMRVASEAFVGTADKQVCELGRERLARPLCRCSSERGLGKPGNRIKGTQPGPGLGGSPQGPSEVAGSDRALAEGTEGQHSLPMLLILPEASTAPKGPCNNPPAPLGKQCHASTRSDSEEFVTCYSDLALHQTPLFHRDLLLSSLQGNQLQDPALAPRPLFGKVVAPSSSTGEQPLVTIPNQLYLTPGPQSPEAELGEATPVTDSISPSASSEIDKLCDSLSHLFRPPTLAGHPGGFLGHGVEEKGQPEHHMGPEPARAQTVGELGSGSLPRCPHIYYSTPILTTSPQGGWRRQCPLEDTTQATADCAAPRRCQGRHPD
ncbi:spermatogenesis-associated protein 2-like protein isoform X1 [Elephas maximus indicus]|uniref:spermatogenesis-associated protein 2-like protein isoform X1 n=1 Tax=Elephas maximus indicus TaxID=99487 RepID=UPI002115DE97|nr:spermatogenesis-associated protein 2-like protein isoform X1 [Elephas maximus indicus]